MRWFNSATRHNYTDDVITSTTNETTVTSQLTVTATADLDGSAMFLLLTLLNRQHLCRPPLLTLHALLDVTDTRPKV